MGEAPPSAHDAGGRTPAGDRAVVSGTRRKPGFPRAAREAAAGARPVARTTVPDRRGEAVAPHTVGTNASHVYAVGGKTPAPRCRVISRTERQPGIQGPDREAPPGARPAPGAAVKHSNGEAIAPDTVERSAPHIYAVGGKTAAPRCTAIARAERSPGTAGAAREAPPGARPTPGATVAEPDREAVAPGTGGRSAPRVHAVGGKTAAPRCTAIARAKRQPGTAGAAREAPPGARPTPGATVAEPDREAVAPGTGGRSAPRVHAVGGKTAAPRCTAIARAKRQPGTAGAARETAARARPAAGTTVPDR